MLRLLYILLPCLLWGTLCFADGKMYVLRDSVPQDIPYQRALILHKDGQQVLLLQSKVGETSDEEMAWVVPVPAQPELSSIEASKAEQVFFWLSLQSRPNAIALTPFAVSLLPLVILVLALCSHRNPAKFKRLLNWSIFSVLFITLPYIIMIPATGVVRESGIETLNAAQVGIYETHTIRSDSADALLEWLRKNGFAYSENDLPTLEHYVASGWCFITAKVRAGAEIEADRSGLIDPLVLSFPSPRPVYPLALTATIGTPTEVLLYVIAAQKMQCNERMNLQYSDTYSPARIITLFMFDDSNEAHWFSPFEQAQGSLYLTKFSAVMSPEEMREDLFFTPAPSNKPFRKTVLVW